MANRATTCYRWLLNDAPVQSLLRARLLHTSSTHKCHYKVLGVKRTAKQKEIKNAFVKLSKRLHPDVNPDPVNHERFVKLNEAYSVLSKPVERRQYDQELASRLHMESVRKANGPYQQNAATRQYYTSHAHEEFDADRMRAEQEYWKQYVVPPKTATRRYKNSHVVAAIALFAFVGNALQFYLFRYQNRRFEEKALEDTRKINLQYQAIRKFALDPGFEERHMLLRERLLEKEKVNLAKYNRTLNDADITIPVVNSQSE